MVSDMLSGDKIKLELKADCSVNMTIPGYGARVWKMKA